jgi:hypothetical protein
MEAAVAVVTNSAKLHRGLSESTQYNEGTLLMKLDHQLVVAMLKIYKI